MRSMVSYAKLRSARKHTISPLGFLSDCYTPPEQENMQQTRSLFRLIRLPAGMRYVDTEARLYCTVRAWGSAADYEIWGMMI